MSDGGWHQKGQARGAKQTVQHEHVEHRGKMRVMQNLCSGFGQGGRGGELEVDIALVKKRHGDGAFQHRITKKLHLFEDIDVIFFRYIHT